MSREQFTKQGFTPDEIEELLAVQYKDFLKSSKREAKFLWKRILREYLDNWALRETNTLSSYHYSTEVPQDTSLQTQWWLFDRAFSPEIPENENWIHDKKARSRVRQNQMRVIVLHDNLKLTLVDVPPYPIVDEWRTISYEDKHFSYIPSQKVQGLYVVRTGAATPQGNIALSEDLVTAPHEFALLQFLQGKNPITTPL